MENDTCRVSGCPKLIDHKRNRLCKMHQSRWRRNGTTNTVRVPAGPRPPCTVTGCSNLARSSSAALCPKHYHREYRHGDVEMTAAHSGVTVSHGRLYRNIYVPGHPVAGKRGLAYEHRVVLYDRIGAGAHDCHWCGLAVSWAAAKCDPDVLQVDHLNGRGDDNEPSNLVPSCRGCNTARALQARHEALKGAGFWSAHDTIERTSQGRRAPVRASAGQRSYPLGQI